VQSRDVVVDSLGVENDALESGLTFRAMDSEVEGGGETKPRKWGWFGTKKGEQDKGKGKSKESESRSKH
jgi:hypothetical protein